MKYENQLLNFFNFFKLNFRYVSEPIVSGKKSILIAKYGLFLERILLYGLI